MSRPIAISRERPRLSNGRRANDSSELLREFSALNYNQTIFWLFRDLGVIRSNPCYFRFTQTRRKKCERTGLGRCTFAPRLSYFQGKKRMRRPFSSHGALTGRSRVEVGKGEECCLHLITPESRMDQFFQVIIGEDLTVSLTRNLPELADSSKKRANFGSDSRSKY